MWAIGRDIDTKSAKSTLIYEPEIFFLCLMWIFPHILFVIENLIQNGCLKYYVSETRTPIYCINCILCIHSRELYTRSVQLNFIVLSHGQCCLMITLPHPHEVIILQQTYMQKKKWTVILCSFVRDCSWWCFLCVLFMFWLWNIQQKYCIQKA